MNQSQVEEVRAKEEYSDSQAGGHAGILIFEGDRLLKKSKPGEIKFFEWLAQQDNLLFNDFNLLAPAFYGVEHRHGTDYTVLENLLKGFDHPNIMDCKLGRITWTSNRSQETARNREAKNKLTTTASLGFRVSGLVVKDNQGNKVEQLLKKEAYLRITEANIHEYFRKIVMDGDRLQVEVIEQFISETEKIKNWFERNTEKTFKASSVLYVNGKNENAQCRYIDFTYVEDAGGKTDDNVIEGLQNIIMVWRKLLNSRNLA